MSGSITKRGENSWRLKFDLGRDPVTGKRLTRFVTVRGTKKAAAAELTRLLAAHGAGTLAEPTKQTVGAYLLTWIETTSALGHVSPKTTERYRQLIEQQIVPHLGGIPLQALKPSNIRTWHATILTAGGQDGAALSARTVGHAHRVLHKALADATRYELLTRNPASSVPPPKVTSSEMAILSADEVKTVLAAIAETSIYAQVVVLLSTGMRRGESAGLRWSDIDLDAGKLCVERSIEKTRAGLRIKSPKTKNGRRTISIPAGAIAVLKQHRKAQLELRMELGIGRPAADAFVFGDVEGGTPDPDKISREWKRYTAARGLPKVTLQALRHSHASALIAGGVDSVTVSRRLGHGSPVVTMSTYAHLFDRDDSAVAEAIDTVLGISDQPPE